MPIRRSHNKSRHGCNACKRRKVKCDEKRPVCKSCDQRQEPCTYSERGPLLFMERPTRKRSQRKVSFSSRDQSLFSKSKDSTLEEQGGSPLTTHSPSLDMKQLELVLQWINHTHKLFARNEETRKIWERLLLEEALHAPFLMHGILALSALHLSHIRKDERYIMWLDIAIAHKNNALSMFSEQLRCISQSNAKAMMGFAGLAFAFSLASSLEMQGSKLDALIEVFSMARGIQAVINAEAVFIKASNFAPLFDMTAPEVTIPDDALAALDHLKQLHDRYCLSSPSHNHNREAYNTAINCFRRLIAFTYAEPTSMTVAGGWAIRAPAAYIDGLRNREPLSLVILAHYCVFLHIARDNWCIGSWGREVLEDILAALEPDWQPHVSWVTEQVLGIKPAIGIN